LNTGGLNGLSRINKPHSRSILSSLYSHSCQRGFRYALAAEFQVGPGKAYTSIGAVPWYTLAAIPDSFSGNNPGFVSVTTPYDLHLTSGSDALDKGGASAPEMTKNYLNQNLTPLFQYVAKQSVEARSGLTSLGAYEFNTQAILAPDNKPRSSAPIDSKG
jgi:hypothetical protein